MTVPTIKHELKSWVGLFEALLDGSKTHDLRVMDRDFQVGDLCWVREWDPLKREYTGRDLIYQITYITSGQHVPCAFSPNALHPAMAVLSVTRFPDGFVYYNPFKEKGTRWVDASHIRRAVDADADTLIPKVGFDPQDTERKRT